MVGDDKHGVISDDIPSILTRFGIDPVNYVSIGREQGDGFQRAAGGAEQLKIAAQVLGERFLKGIGQAPALFPAPVFDLPFDRLKVTFFVNAAVLSG